MSLDLGALAAAFMRGFQKGSTYGFFVQDNPYERHSIFWDAWRAGFIVGHTHKWRENREQPNTETKSS
jgi:hypothetical protein